MGDEEELRARIEAQAASRRADAAPPEREPPGREAEHDQPDEVALVPRSREPIRPWLRGESVKTDQPERSDPAPSDGPTGTFKTLDPVRPWLAWQGNAAPPAEPASGPMRPVRPWLREPQPRPVSAETDSPARPGVVLEQHWARERESLIAERAALVAEREVLLAERAALAELRAAPGEVEARTEQPAEPKRGWRPWRERSGRAGSTAAAEQARPRHAAGPRQPAAPDLEPVSPFEVLRSPDRVRSHIAAVPVAKPREALAVAAEPDQVAGPGHPDQVAEPDQANEDAPAGWSRRSLGWLLAPAELPAEVAGEQGAPEEVEAATQAPPHPDDEPSAAPEPSGLPPWRLRPDVEPAAARPPVEPEPEPQPTPEPAVPAAEPAPLGGTPAIGPGTDLPRRLAAANAAAMERARVSTAYDRPDDAEKNDIQTSPPVTGAAFAQHSPPPARVDDKVAPADPKRQRVAVRRALRVGILAAIAVLLAAVLRIYVVAPYYIPSASMEPTLHGCTGCNNDHVLVDKLSYKMHDIHRGDVVVFHRPANWPVSEKVLIKRVIGLPGDTLTARGGIVYIDGLALDEPYINAGCQSGTTNFPKKPVTVPDGHAFVMGDNRCDSSDSRSFGPIADSAVLGRAFVIIWPFGRLHWL